MLVINVKDKIVGNDRYTNVFNHGGFDNITFGADSYLISQPEAYKYFGVKYNIIKDG